MANETVTYQPAEFTPHPLPETGCRWEQTVVHSVMSKSLRRRDMVTCCGCKAKIPYERSWVTVAYGHHGRLPLPTFIHCSHCMMTTDATVAYRKAYQSDKAAGLADPEAIERERKRNEELGWAPEPDE